MNKDVVYLPKKLNGSASNRSKSKSGAGSKSLKYILKNKDKYELICNINNDSLIYPEIDVDSPMFFSHTSHKLMKLLRMSEDIKEFNKNLRICSLYIQLIRCFFIINFDKLSASASQTRPKLLRAKSLSVVRASRGSKASKANRRKYHSV